METVRSTNTRRTVTHTNNATKPNTPKIRKRSLRNSAFLNASDSICSFFMVPWEGLAMRESNCVASPASLFFTLKRLKRVAMNRSRMLSS